MSETANTETILIVDDNPDNLRVLGGILRERGHHIRIAANGKQALESAQAFPPSLIMLDIRMPEMDGYEACRRLKASDRLKNIPVLFISAMTETHDKVQGFECGGADFIAKPFQAEEVLARVETHLKLHEYEKQLKLKAEVSEERFRATFEQASVGIAHVSSEGRFLKVNGRFAEILGYSPEELGGITLRDLTHPDFRESDARDLDSLFGGVIKSFAKEKRYLRKDGTVIDGRVTVSLVSGTSDESDYTVAVLEDITKRKQIELTLRESEEHYRLAFNQQFQFIYILSPEGHVLEINDLPLKIQGVNRKDIVGKLFWQSPAWKDLPEQQEIIKNRIKQVTSMKEPLLVEGIFQTVSGEIHYVDAVWLAVRKSNDSVHSILVQATDITERKQVEEALYESENKYRTLFEKSADAILIIEGDKFIDCNRATIEMLGYKNKKELLETHPSELSPEIQPDGRNSIEKANEILSTVFDQESIRFEWDHKRKNGEVFPVEVLLTPVPFGERKFIHCVWRDITERKQIEEEIRKSKEELELRVKERTRELEASEERFRMAMSSSSLAMWDANLRTGRVTLDKYWAQMMGETESKKVIYAELVSQVPAKSRGQLMATVRDISKGRTSLYDIEHQYRTGEGELRWIRSRGKTVAWDTHGRPLKLIGTNEDITERKEAEVALKMAKQTADEANKAKSDFLANMSHEIRTPMNAVIGLSHLALQTELTEQLSDYLSKINSSALSLLGIINDILDFSKIEAGKMELDSVAFDLNEVMDRVSTVVAYNASEKGLEFIFSQSENVPESLIGDPLRLGQVLLNLITNAVKFTETGEIIVSIERIEQTSNRVMLKFSVQDTGIGLSKKQAKKLFQAFSQADTSTTRQYGGTGLGLSICKNLTEMMGGEIGIESKFYKGSTFWFTADLGYETSDKEKLKSLLASDLQGIRVLIVDDNESSRKILSNILENFSMDVSTVASGEEALEEIDKVSVSDGEHYELILMDWKMPGMDGIEASRRIKENTQLSRIPTIIMVTAYGQLEVKQQAEEIGLEGFIVKPVTPSTMLDAIMAAFGQEQLPAYISQQAQARDIDAIEGILGAKVLLVEDNSINQQVGRELLEGNGLDVKVASNGQEALVAVKEVSFDLIFMDLDMPIMDGYQATVEIRKDSKFKNLPIIALTAHVMEEFREKCLQVGMNDHLSKPIDPDDLFDMLVKWIVPKSRTISHLLTTQPHVKVDRLPEDLPGIDIESGLRKIGGSHILFKKLLKEFHQDYQDATNALTTSLADNNRETAQRLVHTLKGVAGSIGADPLYKAASELEAGLKNKRKKNFKKLIEAFDEALKLVIYSAGFLNEDISTKRSDRDAETKSMESVDRHKLETLLLELDGLLINGDPEVSEQLDRIEGYLCGAGFRPQFEVLKRQIDNYDFDDARKTLSEIARSLNLSMSHV